MILRHKAAALAAAIAAAAFLSYIAMRPAASAQPPRPVDRPADRTVSWYRANPSALDAQLRACADNPGRFDGDINCRNARAAVWAVARDRMAQQRRYAPAMPYYNVRRDRRT